MTIAAAMLFDGCLLLGADTKETQEGLVMVTTKLFQVDSLPIAWAGAGELAVLDGFNRWIDAYSWEDRADWVSFRVSATEALNMLNKAKRQSMRAAGVRPKSRDLGRILVAGYINGVPNILEITNQGESYLHGKRGFAAIGSGENHFRIAKIAIESFMETFTQKKLTITESIFWFLVAIGARIDPNSGLPLQKMKVTPQEVFNAKQEG